MLNVGRLPGVTGPAVTARSSGQEKQDPSNGGNQEVWIANDRTTTLSVGNDRLVVGKDGSPKPTPTATSWQGNQFLEVLNDRTATIKNGNDKLTIEKGNLEIVLQGQEPGGKVTMTVPTSFELKVGPPGMQGSLKFDSSGAELKFGTNVLKIDLTNAELKTSMTSLQLGPATAALKGPTVNVEGIGTASLKAATTTVQGFGLTNVTGALIKIG
jgi:hypothetical protein